MKATAPPLLALRSRSLRMIISCSRSSPTRCIGSRGPHQPNPAVTQTISRPGGSARQASTVSAGRAPFTSDRESAGGAEEEQPEPERVAAAELEVAPAAAADPVEELADAGLLGMLRGEALAVQAPRPLVAVEVVDARGHGVERRQGELRGTADRAGVVLEL